MGANVTTVLIEEVGLVTVMRRALGGCLVRIEATGEEQVLDREYQTTVMNLMGGRTA